MKLMMIAAIAAIVFASAAANAQVVNSVNGTNYLAVVGDNSQGGTCVGPSGPCVSPGRGIPLNYFATSSDVTSGFATVNGQLTSQLSSINTLNLGVTTLNGNVTILNNQYNILVSQIAVINSQLNRALDGAAMGVAMKDAIPNDDDRYAVRVNFGGFDSHAAGGVAFTAKISDNLRAMVNYGQSKSLSAFSGGLNFSFN